MTTDLRQRLSGLRVEVDDATRERQLAAIASALVEPSGPVAVPPRRRRVLRPVTAVALAAVLLIPVAAVASDDAIPGDALFPVKRAAELVWSGFDSDIAARHRVEEVEEAMRRGESEARIQDLLAKASAAVATAGPELEQRLRRLRGQIILRYERRDQSGSGPSTAVPSTDSTPTYVEPMPGAGEGGGEETRDGATPSRTHPPTTSLPKGEHEVRSGDRESGQSTTTTAAVVSEPSADEGVPERIRGRDDQGHLPSTTSTVPSDLSSSGHNGSGQ